MRHLFHVVSNVRPLVWICLYLLCIPLFALFYLALPDGQFNIPDNAPTHYGSWLYYSIVTISTLGFGDFTPTGPAAQCITAVEVMSGLLLLGFFLNAVGSMKSEIDVESEIEKQRRLHEAAQKQLLDKLAPTTLRILHAFVNHAVALNHAKTPQTRATAANDLMRSAAKTSIMLDTLQTRIDMTQWPQMLQDCFTFVADYQLMSTETGPKVTEADADGKLSDEFYTYVSTAADLARKIEAQITQNAL